MGIEGRKRLLTQSVYGFGKAISGKLTEFFVELVCYVPLKREFFKDFFLKYRIWFFAYTYLFINQARLLYCVNF